MENFVRSFTKFAFKHVRTGNLILENFPKGVSNTWDLRHFRDPSEGTEIFQHDLHAHCIAVMSLQKGFSTYNRVGENKFLKFMV